MILTKYISYTGCGYRYWNLYTQSNFLVFSTIGHIKLTKLSLLKYYHAMHIHSNKSFCIIPLEMLFSNIL